MSLLGLSPMGNLFVSAQKMQVCKYINLAARGNVERQLHDGPLHRHLVLNSIGPAAIQDKSSTRRIEV